MKYLYFRGPGSCFMLCEIFSENIHLTKQGIATILRKNGLVKFSQYV